MTQRELVLFRLDELGISCELTEHPAVFTIEEMQKLGIGQKGEICKNLFLRDAKGKRHFLVTLPGGRQADLARPAAAARLFPPELCVGGKARTVSRTASGGGDPARCPQRPRGGGRSCFRAFAGAISAAGRAPQRQHRDGLDDLCRNPPGGGGKRQPDHAGGSLKTDGPPQKGRPAWNGRILRWFQSKR